MRLMQYYSFSPLPIFSHLLFAQRDPFIYEFGFGVGWYCTQCIEQNDDDDDLDFVLQGVDNFQHLR
jgi:hypothetical protein